VPSGLTKGATGAPSTCAEALGLGAALAAGIPSVPSAAHSVTERNKRAPKRAGADGMRENWDRCGMLHRLDWL
jgi:hypothetical protein